MSTELRILVPQAFTFRKRLFELCLEDFITLHVTTPVKRGDLASITMS